MKSTARLLCYILCLFLSFASYSQSGGSLGSCPEYFEGTTFPPTGWSVFDNGVGLQKSWTTVTNSLLIEGTKSAYIALENIGAGNTSEDWLVTPQFTVPANGEVRFLTRRTQTPGSVNARYRVMVSANPIQNYTVGYLLVNEFNDWSLPTVIPEEKKIDLSAYAGQQLYMAFVRVCTQQTAASEGGNWIVDKVRLVPKCSDVIPIEMEDHTQNSVLISWGGTPAPQYQIEYGPQGFTQGTGTVITVTTNPYLITGLSPGTFYQVYVRTVCNSCEGYFGEWSNAFNIGTIAANYCPQPANLTSVLSGNSATLSWTETGSATEWEVVVEPFGGSGVPSGVGTVVTTTSNPYIVTGLLDDSMYNFYVRSICKFENNTSNPSAWTHHPIGHDGDITSCVKTHLAAATVVKTLFINMVNDMLTVINNGGTINSAYSSPQFQALKPYITDPNPAIYNFSYQDGVIRFSFAPHDNRKGTRQDVIITKYSAAYGLMTNFDINNFQTPEFFIENVQAEFDNDISHIYVKHIDFCRSLTAGPCPKRDLVNQLFVNLLNRLHSIVEDGNVSTIVDGFDCPELAVLRPYITDPNARIYNFQAEPFSFSFHPTQKDEDPKFDVFMDWGYGANDDIVSIDSTVFTDASVFTVFNEHIMLANGGSIKTARVRHVNFCPDNSDCSQRETINHLFINLLNHLYGMVLSGNSDLIVDGYDCPELAALRPYITDPNALIYNFNKDPFSFSFHPVEKGENPGYDVMIDWKYGGSAYEISSIDLSGYTNPSTFTDLNHLIVLVNGAKPDKAMVRHINFCPDGNGCPQREEISYIFKNLLNKLHQMVLDGNGSQIVDGFDCPELAALRPYITDPDARIYNFQESPFSFSFHPIQDESPKYDVLLDKWEYMPNNEITSIDLSPYASAATFTVLNSLITLANGQKVERVLVRHVEFCPPDNTSCPQKAIINQLFVDLLNHLHEMVVSGNAGAIVDGYDCSELAALRPYITDKDALIYSFHAEPFSFSFHPKTEEEIHYDVIVNKWPNDNNTAMVSINLSTYVSPVTFTNLNLQGVLSNGYRPEEFKIRHIEFCPPEVNYCIANNPRAAMVRQLFINLVNYLHVYSQTNTIPNGFTCPQLTALTPYITDKDPHIYVFSNSAGSFNFSFHNPQDGEKYDVSLEPWPNGANTNITAMDLTGYQSSAFYTGLSNAVTLQNGSKIEKGMIRHVNFCPDDLCVNHIAIVVDESGSLDDLEKTKIKRQLNYFVAQQAAVNQDTNGNMYLSLIGMSDKDLNGRMDNIVARKITLATLPDFQNWISHYGNRYGDPGVSRGSDYWNSGLKVALDAARQPDMVIMITDGCQTANKTTLKNTMARFNNYYGNAGTSRPHLYVVGIDNGFYVYDNELYTNSQRNNGPKSSDLSASTDPNEAPELVSTNSFVTPEGNVTSNLALSLKYLFNYPGAQFPVSSLTNFNADFFPHETFRLIGEDHFYLSDKIKLAEIGCGPISVKDPCDDCFSFQPEPGKTYVISAWVKEEHMVQVENYFNPKIVLTFKNINEQILVVPVDPSNPSNPTNPVDCVTGGPIIEGWQRIVQRFTVPFGTTPATNTAFMDLKLINQSAETTVFFDDIRIYPVSGSMKTFVYDPQNFKLMSELDENNFATYYEYDQEGGLVRIKKETAEGVKTTQETRSGNYLKE